jgi:deoxyribose-phosphate aldolase
MDSDDVVRKIANEVLKRLGGETPREAVEASIPSPAGQPRPAPVAGPGRTLVLLTGSDGRLDEALVQVGRLAEVCSTTVVLSPSAVRVVGLPAVRRCAPEAEVVTEGLVEKLLDGVAAVYLPNMSLTALAKISGLMPDSLVCILAVQALQRGLPLAAARDSLIPAGLDEARVPRGVHDRIERMLADLTAMGARVCAVEQLAPGPGASGGGSTLSGTENCSLDADDGCSACGLCAEKHPNEVNALVAQGAARVGSGMGVRPTRGVAGLIDHTLLKADATEEQVRKLCEEAREYSFASVCVNPGRVGLAAELLAGSPVKVCTVIGFPLGATTPTAKSVETRDAIANGATEVDMVINVGALKSGDDELVRRDIEAVVNAARGQALTKVIIETALLNREEKVKACLLAKMAGADFVKTSTGFSSGGATVEDISLMRETVGPEMGVKASGGVGNREIADAMVAAGATRIGASASVAIATGQKVASGGY